MHNEEKNTVLELADNNKTQELKCLLEKITSLSTVETDILRAMVELSRGLKIE